MPTSWINLINNLLFLLFYMGQKIIIVLCGVKRKIRGIIRQRDVEKEILVVVHC